MNLKLVVPYTAAVWISCVVWAGQQFWVTRASSSCAFHAVDGVAAESEGLRFIRLREDTEIGKQILVLRAYPRSNTVLQSPEGSGDHKYFALREINATTVLVTLSRSLKGLVDRDVPKNLLKFRIACAGINEKIEEGNYISITVYIEDVNDNAPEFLNTPYIVDVDENTSPGSVVFEGVQAFDRDKPNTPNSEVHFSMSTVPEQLSADGSPFFALKSPHRPQLVLKRELDFDNGIRLFKLPLFAWDRGTPVNQVNTTITINVRDVDDLPPKFTEGVYRTKVNEFYPMTGTPTRVPLYFSPPIMAYDQDSLNASLVYEIISGNERKLFRVNPNNGIIYLQKEVDLEEESLPGNTFVLQIEARQRENPLKKALARVEVEILDLNDNVPEFEADFYNISIVENLPSGFSVLQVNAVDRDQGENSEFLYNLVEERSAANAFRIDPRSGWITVRDDRLLDREKRKSIQLVVEANERNEPFMIENNLRNSAPNSVKVEITLLDTNDNTPKFENGNLYEFKVAVTSPVGHRIGQVLALDPDEGPNGQLLYELQRPKGSGYIPFQLDSKNGTIVVAGPLRRGRIAVFVEASDQPTNPSERRFSLAVITIEVYATIDDHAIDFVGAPYEFWVGANVPLGTSVGHVRTNLIYEGEEEIMYDLLHTYSEGVPFAIEERSGIITVIRELKEFTRRTYFFEAVANYLFANSSQPLMLSRSSQPFTTIPAPEMTDEGVLITNVTIHVVNKPENRVPLRPVVEEINMNSINFHIEENLVRGVIGQLLYKNGINVVNNDLSTYRDLQQTSNITLGSRFRSRNQRLQTKSRHPRRLVGESNMKLRYIIANQQEVSNKITITDDGTLLTLTGLDREQQSSYDLTIIVEYSTGQMSGAGIYQVNVKVDDINDNAPKFNAPAFIGLINENSAVGSEVSINQPIQISDADEGKNAEFRVVLQGDYSDMFAITYINETDDVDNSSHRHSLPTVETFNIFNITEQWNEELQFSEMQKVFQQSTNRRIGSGNFFRITFTGKRPLDREKDQLYSLKMLAMDSGGLSGYATLSILVADVNDNAPQFERISVFKDSNVEIREYNTDMEIYFVESSLTQMSSLPAKVVLPPYHIPGSPRLNTDLFPINSSSFSSIHHRLRPRSRGRSRHRITRTIVPHAQKCPLFALLEDVPLATKVLQVIANDEDFGKNSQVHYEITGENVDWPPSSQLVAKVQGAKHFTIDKITGELLVNHQLMANIAVFLNISATDIDGLQDFTCLRFMVIDVNNHAPVFKKTWYSFESQEGWYNDSVLGQVVAVDLDYGTNANITYALNEINLPFKIKKFSGVIKIDGLLDREVNNNYNFQVVATDGAEPLHRLSSSVYVEVNVVDVNDNKPEFIGYDDFTKANLYLNDITDDTLMLPIYKAYLDRSTNPGIFVKQVNAIDKDFVGNGNGLVLYSILHQSMHPPIFQIDSRDGTITTVTNFKSYNDYEHLNLTVIASDLGSPVHSSTAVVLINLQGQAVTETMPQTEDKPEPSSNTPLFQHQYYEVQIAENNEIPTVLMKINLTSETAASETYRWTLYQEGVEAKRDTPMPFEIDAKSFILSALISFDRENVDRYQLRVRADRPNREGRTYTKLSYPVTDERIEGLQLNECRVVVYVLDENDSAPKFKGNGRPMIAVVPRAASFGYPVSTVMATDADAGLNAEIRYRLLNEHSHMFAIDELSGKIRLIAAVPMEERLYGFDVKATDRGGADDGRSSIANVFVYVIDEKRQVRIVVAGKPLEVERRIDALMQVLSEALQMDLRVRLLEPHEGGLEPATDAYVYAVDFRTNSVLEMEQLQDSLASLQLEALQLQQQQQAASEGGGGGKSTAIMPRIIELAEFGQLSHSSRSPSAHFMGGVEVISVVLLALCMLGAAMAALCFLCLRQKR